MWIVVEKDAYEARSERKRTISVIFQPIRLPHFDMLIRKMQQTYHDTDKYIMKEFCSIIKDIQALLLGMYS